MAGQLKPTEAVRFFYLSQIEKLISHTQRFELYTHNTGASVDQYYIIGRMSDGYIAVYSPFSYVEIIRGFNDYGFPITTGVEYKVSRWGKRNKTQLDVREENMVKRVRELIKLYKKQR